MTASFFILLIDDDPALLAIVEHAAKDTFAQAHFLQLTSLRQTLDYFQADQPRPTLVLLDLKLEDEQSGLAILTFLRTNEATRPLPVVMLTVSQSPADVVEAYDLGISSFTRKPESLQGWRDYFIQLRSYWKDTVSLPSK